MAEQTEIQTWYENFLRNAQVFEENSIIPQRVMKAKRKVKHMVRFGSKSRVMSTPWGYLVACYVTHDPNSCAVRITGTGKIGNLVGAPYHKNGNTTFVGILEEEIKDWPELLFNAYHRIPLKRNVEVALQNAGVHISRN